MAEVVTAWRGVWLFPLRKPSAEMTVGASHVVRRTRRGDFKAPHFPANRGDSEVAAPSGGRQFGDEPVLDAFACPRCLAQEGEAGFHRGMKLEAADRDSACHLIPAVPLDEVLHDGLQRDAVQRVVRMGMGCGLGHAGISILAYRANIRAVVEGGRQK